MMTEMLVVVPVSRSESRMPLTTTARAKEIIKLLVPQGNVYGQKLPGLVEKIYQTTVEGQKEELEKIKELEGEELDVLVYTLWRLLSRQRLSC